MDEKLAEKILNKFDLLSERFGSLQTNIMGEISGLKANVKELKANQERLSASQEELKTIDEKTESLKIVQ